jgi:hypothetical protein
MPINYTRIKNIKDIRNFNQLLSCVKSENSMKYINDLTYLSHIAQTKLVAKDKKQKNKYSQIALINDDQCSDDVSDEILEDLPLIEEENERRAGDDRRKTQQNRGRYIESRLTKNRRYKKEVFLVI